MSYTEIVKFYADNLTLEEALEGLLQAQAANDYEKIDLYKQVRCELQRRAREGR